MIGRFVDVHAGLDEIAVTCAGTLVATHQRCWATHQNITDPAHVVAAAELRSAYQARTAATRGPRAATGTEVGQRSLSHYDPSTPHPGAAPSEHQNNQVTSQNTERRVNFRSAIGGQFSAGVDIPEAGHPGDLGSPVLPLRDPHTEVRRRRPRRRRASPGGPSPKRALSP